MDPTVVALPGMDGTGSLFAEFAVAWPTIRVVAYPADALLGYDDLCSRVSLPRTRFVLLGESFSGPLAIRLAAEKPPGLEALVLVASFADPPAPTRLAPWIGSWLFRVPPPAPMVRALLAGSDASDDLVAATRAALSAVSPEVLAYRLRALLRVDVRSVLARVRVPVLVLSGRRDRLVGERATRRLLMACPSATHVALDAPHLVLQRRPAEAAAELRSFLTGSGSPK